MCGITGLISKNDINDADVFAMTSALAHRGPDAQNVMINSEARVALGHTRLSVIDLSPQANQPMTSADGIYSIVFNGEIYNYKTLRDSLISLTGGDLKFRTNSDTEVILQGFIYWGSDVCKRLEGMFAFAIFDSNTQQVFLCRDSVGKKPLYYYSNEKLLAFASEPKSLLRHPAIRNDKTVNYDAIYTFLHTGYIPEPQTAYTAILKFPSGHFAFVKSDLSMTISSYKQVPDPTHIDGRKPNGGISEVKSALIHAVNRRLISDVPLGAFLSGGTDSSLIVALAVQHKAPSSLKTFNVGFKDSQFDETRYARRVSEVLGTDHHEYMLAEEEALGILEEYLSHFDEPFADTSAIPMMLISRLAKREVTVALTGDGGDELFLGYGAYDWANRLDQFWVSMLQTPVAYALKKIGNSRLKRIGFIMEKVRKTEVRSHIFSQEQYFFTRSEIRRMALKSEPTFHTLEYSDPVGHLNGAEKQALYDLRFYLKDDLLMKVDRASMRHGLECRCPFLDPEVMKAAMSLPYRLKKKGRERKWILKEILKQYLPENLVYRQKWGFSIPLIRWMKNDLAYLGDMYLSDAMVSDIGIVDKEYVRRLRSSFSNGNDFLYNRLWVLIVAHKWLYDNAA